MGTPEENKTSSPLSDPSVVATQKAKLRNLLLSNRSVTSQADSPDHESAHEIDDRICRSLAKFLVDRSESGRWIVLYSSLPGEPDLSKVPEMCVALGAERSGERFRGRFALTRTEQDPKRLSVHPSDVELEVHTYGYLQPVSGSSVVPDEEIGIVLVPGLAFDRTGRRLGFGGGYYDRFLSRLLANRLDCSKLTIVGVCRDVPITAIPVEEHDVAMTHLVNEVDVQPVNREA